MSVNSGDCKESEPSTSSSAESSKPCRIFEFSEIQSATQNFDESLVIGKGGFGKVYKGNIINGSDVVVAAIKRLDPFKQGLDAFRAEVELLSKLSHCNVVPFIGYCNSESEMILLCEYMPNGTLEHHLHKLHTPLSWIQRLNICIGAARGLDHVHNSGIGSGVVHCDVKTSNILLDENWAAKVSDFGSSRIGEANQPSTYIKTRHYAGSFGYLDPDYFNTGRLTRRSDVYAFGVVLLEVLCRKRAVFEEEESINLAKWSQESIKAGKLKHIIDSDIRGEISPKCLKDFVRITERCLHSNPKQRPTMAEVVFSLESILTLQEKKNKSLQAAGGTIFDKMRNMFPFSSVGENYVQHDSKLSSNSEASNKTKRAPIKLIVNPRLKVFTFADLKRATGDFSEDFLLGQGGFGKVFLAWVDPNTLNPSTSGVGIAVAVKRLDGQSRQGHAEWEVEVNFLGQMVHPNIITLLGFCREEDERLLVYEYMPNRSLDRVLFTGELSWERRLMIMIGVARGLIYMHTSNLICRSLKGADILLDEDFNSKLGDFGLVKSIPEIGKTHVSTRIMGTIGYIDPEYFSTGNLTAKTDIYCFGVLLLESLTGRKILDFNLPVDEHNLVNWATQILDNKRNIKKIMDPCLQNNYPVDDALKCAELALRCLAPNRNHRPSSAEVLQSLEQISAVTGEWKHKSRHSTLRT